MKKYKVLYGGDAADLEHELNNFTSLADEDWCMKTPPCSHNGVLYVVLVNLGWPDPSDAGSPG